MASWYEQVRAQLASVADAFWSEVQTQGLLPLIQPVAPFNEPAFAAPAVAVGGVITGLLLAGVAVASLGAFLLAIVALYLLLVQVFGVSVELHPFGAR